MLKLYNTLTRKKEIFKPLKDKKVNMFVCGITPYNYPHIGNGKTYLQFDFLAKYLRHKNYDVFYLQNITDIDDKIIKKANEEKTDWKKIARKFEKVYMENMKALKIDSINKYARATDYIAEIVSQVKRLIEKGFAYKISDGYYFDITKFKEYGKLAKRTKQQEDDAISRIDENPEKRNKGDFCLWKFRKENEPYWETDINSGRPGWHIEDTAITEKFFGPQYDLHGGAVDLIFPHHEAEIAQMESLSKKPLVKYWVHAAFLNIKKEKMSKSKGNFMTMEELLNKHKPEVIRYSFLSQHYRTPIEFSEELMEDAKNSLERINDFILKLKEQKDTARSGKILEKAKKEFEDNMDDDLNTPNALAVIFNLIRDLNKINEGGKKVLKFLKEINSFFGFLEFEELKIPKEIAELVKKREEARKSQNYNEADRIRNLIESKGYTIEDTDKKPVIKKK
ncbi:cysteine--tRNA ligase [Candidatus Woesearchaeota archaeon]|nr:cysteine--tRNA ligase [Candidatus Woesearchaeota archaeon]